MKGWMRSGSRMCVKYSENKPWADLCYIGAHGSFPDMAQPYCVVVSAVRAAASAFCKDVLMASRRTMEVYLFSSA